eukprot:2380874-Rhodomonas_salina.1
MAVFRVSVCHQRVRTQTGGRLRDMQRQAWAGESKMLHGRGPIEVVTPFPCLSSCTSEGRSVSDTTALGLSLIHI